MPRIQRINADAAKGAGDGRDGCVLSELVICYLFLGGAGAGALTLLSCAEGVRAWGVISRTSRGISYELCMAPRELLTRSWTICVVFLLLGAVCLAIDLGRLGDVWKLFLHARLTPLAVGAYSLVVALACATTLAIASAFDNLGRSRRTLLILAATGMLSGMVTMVYTGVLLQGMVSVAAWQTPLLPMLFLLSSLSCGAAMVLGSAAFVEARRPFLSLVAALLRFDGVVIVLETVVLAAFVVTCLANGPSTVGGWELISGSLAACFWCGLVGVGLLLPFVLERLVSYASHRAQLVWIAVSILIGGFMVRWCVAGLADFDPVRAYAVMSYVSPVGVF